MNNQINIDLDEINIKHKEENNKEKRILKAINLIDDFVTKFVSKIEYYKLTLESQINQSQLTLLNSPLLINNNKTDAKEKTQSKDIKTEKEENRINKELNIEDEYLNKFISTKTFYKRTLYLLYLITEDKSKIEKIIKADNNITNNLINE